MKQIKSKDGDIFMIDRIRGTGEYVIRISHIKGNEYNYQAVITSDFATKMIEAMLEEINDRKIAMENYLKSTECRCDISELSKRLDRLEERLKPLLDREEALIELTRLSEEMGLYE